MSDPFWDTLRRSILTEKIREHCPTCGSPRVEADGFTYNHRTGQWILSRRCKDCKHRWWFMVDADSVRHDLAVKE